MTTCELEPAQATEYGRLLTVAEVEAALDALLGAIEAAEAAEAQQVKSPAAKAPEFRCISMAELADTDPDVWHVEDLMRDPVGLACREQIKRLGKMLFRITNSTATMLETLERVAARNPARESSRAVILDKWWSGIGSGDDVWLA